MPNREMEAEAIQRDMIGDCKFYIKKLASSKQYTGTYNNSWREFSYFENSLNDDSGGCKWKEYFI